MISNRISDDVSPQMKILNMVITILMYCTSAVSSQNGASRPHKAARYSAK